MRQGVLLQNLGSLLLELGRTTMTLRINPAPVGFCDNYVYLISDWKRFCICTSALTHLLFAVRSSCKFWTGCFYISIWAKPSNGSCEFLKFNLELINREGMYPVYPFAN